MYVIRVCNLVKVGFNKTLKLRCAYGWPTLSILRHAYYQFQTDLVRITKICVISKHQQQILNTQGCINTAIKISVTNWCAINYHKFQTTNYLYISYQLIHSQINIFAKCHFIVKTDYVQTKKRLTPRILNLISNNNRALFQSTGNSIIGSIIS